MNSEMSDNHRMNSNLPPEQEAIRAKCFHPSGTFVEFTKEEIEQSIPERFEKIAQMYPDRIAVKEIDHIVTYAELHGMGNRVARVITSERGNQAEPVALLIKSVVLLATAMLGVLKAGKFFVIIDPSFQAARIRELLEDSQAAIVISDRQNVSLAKELATARLPLLEMESIDSYASDENLKIHVPSKALACIVYTSGSTGQPKGVMLAHRYVLHHTMLRSSDDHACERDRMTLLASGTASAVNDVFCALLTGAALFPFDVQKEGVNRLASWLLQQKITISQISSPLFRNLCEVFTGAERFADLRVIRLRSEAVYRSHVDLYKRFFPFPCVLINSLTSTETGLLRSYVIDHNSEITGNEVPLGYAVEDKEIFLLNEESHEVGFNRVGKIVVRSKYLSPGYWNRPDLTEAKFKPDPEGAEEHLYLTGDLGVMLPDGCLVHKGRKDFRVKIRGYGVELVEVEKCLRDHAKIRDVVVVAPAGDSGEARLVAYFTSFRESSPTVSELRVFLKKNLPDYMVPSAFVMLDTIPLTPNGKLDRQALPEPDKLRPRLDTSYAAPTIPAEEQLAEIWSQILALDRVGVHDNFFDLGGHSLAATRVMSQVIKTFQLELPLQSLFQSPTVAEMAAVIAEHQGKKLDKKELNRILTEMELLSDTEASRLVEEARDRK